MNNYSNDKELRNLIFMSMAIILSLVVCVTSIVSKNILGIVISVMLLALLSIIFGYIYCKYEENGVLPEKKKTVENSPSIKKNIFGGISVPEAKKEEKTVENNTEKPANNERVVGKIW